MSAPRSHAGLAAAAGVLAEQILKRDQEKRDFHDKLQAALFENQLKTGAIRPAKPGEKPTSTYGDIGFMDVSPAEAGANEAAKIQQANRFLPGGIQGSYLPEVPGMKFHPSRVTSPKAMLDQKRAMAMQLSPGYVTAPPETKALIDFVAKGGDPSQFQYVPKPKPSAPSSPAWLQGIQGMFGRGLLPSVPGGSAAPSGDPIRSRILLLKQRGMSDQDISKALQEKGIDPAQYGL